MRVRRIAHAVSVLGLAGCMHLTDPAPATRSQLVVHAVLDTRADQQTILISRARTGIRDSSAIGSNDEAPVTAAIVVVTSPTGAAMTASEPGPGLYMFKPSQYGIDLAAGGTYTLQITTVTGERVSGSTTVPAAPAQVSTIPERIFYRERDTLQLSWPEVPGARSYEVVIDSHAFAAYRTFVDTSLTMAGTAVTITGDMIFPYTLTDVAVSAVDQNYYDYYRAQSDPFAGAPPRGLTGAVGVFGSIATILYTQLNVR